MVSTTDDRFAMQEVESEKQKNLKGDSKSPVEGAPGWNEKVRSAEKNLILLPC